MNLAKRGGTVHVAIGGNVGDVVGNLSEAVRLIDSLEGVSVEKVSPLYKTAPVGGPVNEDGTPAQPDFHNGALELTTSLEPLALMDALLEIELELGRRRLVTDGPRTVDLDIVLWGERVLVDKRITVPHPRMHLRDFVLRPLARIAPDAMHPLEAKSVAELLQALGSDEPATEPLAFDPL